IRPSPTKPVSRVIQRSPSSGSNATPRPLPVGPPAVRSGTQSGPRAKGAMLYDRIRELPKLASYPQSSVLLPPGGASATLAGAVSESVRSYDSRFRTSERGGRAGLSEALAPQAKASPKTSID